MHMAITGQIRRKWFAGKHAYNEYKPPRAPRYEDGGERLSMMFLDVEEMCASKDWNSNWGAIYGHFKILN